MNQHSPAGELPAGLSPGGVAAYDKSGLLRDYVARYAACSLVETGLYQGHGSGMDVPGVDYLAIDWQPENVDAARGAGYRAACGDSAVVLADVIGHVAAPALFWLDAHAISDDEGSPTVCPLMGELAAIIGWEHAGSSVVLIDDLWGMGTIRGWPTLDELREAADAPGLWDRDEEMGVMRLTPRAR
jgi:hypothetical protein